MPPKKRSGKPVGPAGATIPGVKALLRACLKAMSVEVERMSDQEDVTALRKAFDDALMRSSGLRRAVNVSGLPDWGDTACPDSSKTGLQALRGFFTRCSCWSHERSCTCSDCFTIQENAASQSMNGIPNYESDPVLAAAMKRGIPMLEVRSVMASMAAGMGKPNAMPMLLVVQPPAEDFSVAVYINRVCLWETPDGPVPVLDVAFTFADKRSVGTNPDHPSVKVVRQLMEHVQAAGGACASYETEFSTDGAKAFALMLERNASILGAKVCDAMKARWTLPPLAARRMHASVLLPVKVLGAAEARKVETRGGRACAACKKALPVTAAVCAACNETYYCGPECQAQHWAEHKKACKKSQASFEGAVEVQHGYNPFSQMAQGEDLISQSVSMLGGRMSDGASTSLGRGRKLPAMPGSGFIVKVQVGLESPDATPMVVYPRGKRFETFIPPSAPCHRVLVPIVRARGFQGLKLYMWASRKSDESFVISVADFPDQDQGW